MSLSRVINSMSTPNHWTASTSMKKETEKKKSTPWHSVFGCWLCLRSTHWRLLCFAFDTVDAAREHFSVWLSRCSRRDPSPKVSHCIFYRFKIIICFSICFNFIHCLHIFFSPSFICPLVVFFPSYIVRARRSSIFDTKSNYKWSRYFFLFDFVLFYRRLHEKRVEIRRL